MWHHYEKHLSTPHHHHHRQVGHRRITHYCICFKMGSGLKPVASIYSHSSSILSKCHHWLALYPLLSLSAKTHQNWIIQIKTQKDFHFEKLVTISNTFYMLFANLPPSLGWQGAGVPPHKSWVVLPEGKRLQNLVKTFKCPPVWFYLCLFWLRPLFRNSARNTINTLLPTWKTLPHHLLSIFNRATQSYTWLRSLADCTFRPSS